MIDGVLGAHRSPIPTPPEEFDLELAAHDMQTSCEGARYQDATGLNDTLVRLVHPDPDGVDSAQYASITTTVLAPGMTAAGMALGVELAQRIKSITGRPTSFGSSVTGRYGEVGFIVLSDTIDEVQGATEALAGDADWISLLDGQASKVFVAGATEHMITRRLA